MSEYKSVRPLRAGTRVAGIITTLWFAAVLTLGIFQILAGIFSLGYSLMFALMVTGGATVGSGAVYATLRAVIRYTERCIRRELSDSKLAAPSVPSSVLSSPVPTGYIWSTTGVLTLNEARELKKRTKRPPLHSEHDERYVDTGCPACKLAIKEVLNDA